MVDGARLVATADAIGARLFHRLFLHPPLPLFSYRATRNFYSPGVAGRCEVFDLIDLAWPKQAGIWLAIGDSNRTEVSCLVCLLSRVQ
jgi:hypothetical protein